MTGNSEGGNVQRQWAMATGEGDRQRVTINGDDQRRPTATINGDDQWRQSTATINEDDQGQRAMATCDCNGQRRRVKATAVLEWCIGQLLWDSGVRKVASFWLRLDAYSRMIDFF